MAKIRMPDDDAAERDDPQGPDGGGEDSGLPIFNIAPSHIDPDSRVGEGPRERPIPMPAPAGPDGSGYVDSQHNQIHQPSQATPSRPRAPQPMAGGVSQAQSGSAPPPSPGLIPFQPMESSTADMSIAGPQLAMSRLFGSQGGLKGGGLGVPMDPMSNQLSDPITDLLKKILGGDGGL